MIRCWKKWQFFSPKKQQKISNKRANINNYLKWKWKTKNQLFKNIIKLTPGFRIIFLIKIFFYLLRRKTKKLYPNKLVVLNKRFVNAFFVSLHEMKFCNEKFNTCSKFSNEIRKIKDKNSEIQFIFFAMLNEK